MTCPSTKAFLAGVVVEGVLILTGFVWVFYSIWQGFGSVQQVYKLSNAELSPLDADATPGGDSHNNHNKNHRHQQQVVPSSPPPPKKEPSQPNLDSRNNVGSPFGRKINSVFFFGRQRPKGVFSHANSFNFSFEP